MSFWQLCWGPCTHVCGDSQPCVFCLVLASALMASWQAVGIFFLSWVSYKMFVIRVFLPYTICRIYQGKPSGLEVSFSWGFYLQVHFNSHRILDFSVSPCMSVGSSFHLSDQMDVGRILSGFHVFAISRWSVVIAFLHPWCWQSVSSLIFLCSRGYQFYWSCQRSFY